MRLIKLKWTVPKELDGGKLTAIGDVHLGNRYHDSVPFEKNLEWLYDHKEQKILTMGDLIECSNRHSLGLPDQVMEVQDQKERMIKYLEPFAKEGRIIGMIQGNHEERALIHAGVNITKDLANYLEVEYIGAGAVYYLKVKKEGKNRGQNYSFYAKHGSSGAATSGGKINAIMRMRDVVNADLYFMGHVHDLDHKIQDVFDIDRGHLRLRRKHYVLTGSYLLYGGYAEIKGYAPAGPSGSARVSFHSDEHRIEVKI